MRDVRTDVMTQARYENVVRIGGAEMGKSAGMKSWLGDMTKLPAGADREYFWRAVWTCEAVAFLGKLANFNAGGCGIDGEGHGFGCLEGVL